MEGEWVLTPGTKLDRTFVSAEGAYCWWWVLRQPRKNQYTGGYDAAFGATTFEPGCGIQWACHLISPRAEDSHSSHFRCCDCPCHWKE